VQLLGGARQVAGLGHAPEVQKVVEIELVELHCSVFMIKTI
jgi:hypothetical protein